MKNAQLDIGLVFKLNACRLLELELFCTPVLDNWTYKSRILLWNTDVNYFVLTGTMWYRKRGEMWSPEKNYAYSALFLWIRWSAARAQLLVRAGCWRDIRRWGSRDRRRTQRQDSDGRANNISSRQLVLYSSAHVLEREKNERNIADVDVILNNAILLLPVVNLILRWLVFICGELIVAFHFCQLVALFVVFHILHAVNRLTVK